MFNNRNPRQECDGICEKKLPVTSNYVVYIAKVRKDVCRMIL